MSWSKNVPLSTESFATSQGTLSGNFIKIEGVLGSTTLSSGLTLVQGSLVYAKDTQELAMLAKSTTEPNYLSNLGTSNNPSWTKINVSSGVTGILNVANGGTGATSILGDWVAKTFSTVYQAASDGFVCAYAQKETVAMAVEGLTDSNNPPTTDRIVNQVASSAYAGIMFPVKKNDYWKVVATNTTGTAGLFWIPLCA